MVIVEKAFKVKGQGHAAEATAIKSSELELLNRWMDLNQNVHK